MRSVPAPWRATESEPQASQRWGTRSRWPQWWQAIARSARCSTSATSHCGHSHTFPHERHVRKFDQPRRLSSTIDLRAAPQRAARLRVQRVLRAAHVEHAHGRQRAGVDADRAAAGAGNACHVSGRGVAEPASNAAPARRARSAATRRAS